MIDGRIRPLMATLLIAAVFSWFGIIHSPLASSPILSPSAVMEQLKAEGRDVATAHQTPYHWAGAYALTAVALLILYRYGKPALQKSSQTSHLPA
jgi:AGZA family xanthine/uracil permease-like MFS transporter